MGAWGNSYFDNDSALDFVGELLDGETLEVLVEFDGQHISSDSALGVVAYAAILSGMRPTDYYGETELRRVDLLVLNTAPKVRKEVKKLLKIALNPKRSELYGSYYEDTQDEWYLNAKKLLDTI